MYWRRCYSKILESRGSENQEMNVYYSVVRYPSGSDVKRDGVNAEGRQPGSFGP
jgi:hypothetical protein